MTDDAKRCAGCRHWGRDDAERGVIDSRVIYDRAHLPHRICDRIEWLDRRKKEQMKEPPAADVPFVLDAEEYHAALWTPAGFGCELWEEKAEAT